MRKYTSLQATSKKTIKSTMSRLYGYVKHKMKSQLPERFGLIFDGWSNGTSEHVVAVYAVGASECGAFIVLLGINELNERGNQNASNHIDYIKNLLSEYDRNTSCLDFIVGDNTNLNPKIARNLGPGTGVPFIGCYSHKFNLAVSQYQECMESIIKKVEEVMKVMRNNNAFGILKEYCESKSMKLKRPQLRNITRWSSTYVMLKSYMELHSHLFHESFESIEVVDKLLTPEEYGNLREYLPKLEELNDVTKALQRESLTLVEARTIFDVVLEKFGSPRSNCPFRKYLGHYKTSVFETAVIKVGKNEPLNVAETISLRRFQIYADEDSEPTISATEEEDSHELSVMDQVERTLKRQRTDTTTAISNRSIEYGPMYHISPTSNICERLFSQAKIVYSERRKSMKLETLEMLLFLKSNKRFWNVRSFDEIIAAKKASTSDVELFFENLHSQDENEEDVIVPGSSFDDDYDDL